VTVKIAFMFGSSKHGKTRLASVGSICETAMYLSSRRRDVTDCW
jgi:hypothetical protein